MGNCRVRGRHYSWSTSQLFISGSTDILGKVSWLREKTCLGHRMVGGKPIDKLIDATVYLGISKGTLQEARTFSCAYFNGFLITFPILPWNKGLNFAFPWQNGSILLALLPCPIYSRREGKSRTEFHSAFDHEGREFISTYLFVFR